MKVVAVREGEQTPTLMEKPRPEPAAGEALVRTLRVGVDGTDHEVLGGGHGGFPEGEDHLVLGHEAVGVVEDPNGTRFEAGDVVVPTVRRAPEGQEDNEFFARGEPDMTPSGQYQERGIVGAHGFMAEYFTSPGEYLVPLPPELTDIGFLVEPLSITEKALELSYASRSSFEWNPESAMVLGNGCLGLLTLGMFEHTEGIDRSYCLGRRDRPDPTVDIIEAIGATYVDSRETAVDELPDTVESMDLVYEATGYAPHAFQTIEALAPNGVGALLGIPGSWEFEIDGGALHEELVLHNKALIGSVNSHVRHFEGAIEDLQALPDWLIDDVITGVYGTDELDAAFDDSNTTIKTAVELSTR
ncbi:glucose 1-dehydrogenase [Salinarchaeum laminariae]|uniref:glucose 1-dehydrogenase n=1 Tax=Salinarchaeum laminariae TaxID=869888 RepID=UPI0020BE0DD3|nr:glucose 1-dehydrogenase [Salinarchaeum laminariae]